MPHAAASPRPGPPALPPAADPEIRAVLMHRGALAELGLAMKRLGSTELAMSWGGKNIRAVRALPAPAQVLAEVLAEVWAQVLAQTWAGTPKPLARVDPRVPEPHCRIGNRLARRRCERHYASVVRKALVRPGSLPRQGSWPDKVFVNGPDRQLLARDGVGFRPEPRLCAHVGLRSQGRADAA
jgi:hypothetical protein